MNSFYGSGCQRVVLFFSWLSRRARSEALSRRMSAAIGIANRYHIGICHVFLRHVTSTEEIPRYHGFPPKKHLLRLLLFFGKRVDVLLAGQCGVDVLLAGQSPHLHPRTNITSSELIAIAVVVSTLPHGRSAADCYPLSALLVGKNIHVCPMRC